MSASNYIAVLCILAISLSCTHPEPVVRPSGTPLTITSPLGLPPLDIPAGNPPTAETVALGRKLFSDPQLSRDNSISCKACHDPATGFADPRPVSIGVGGRKGTRNAPTIVNAAYLTTQFWDGRAPTLEKQAEGPISNPVEMDLEHQALVDRLNASPEYRSAFAKAFRGTRITMDHVAKAISAFERTLLSGNSPFDRYRFGGEKNAMPEAAIRGLAIFEDKQKGNCAVCHTIEAKYALFTDGKFHNIGVGIDPEGELRDLGRYLLTNVAADRGAFRTSSLRNIALTAPYMHDGSQKTLREVVDFYVGGGNSNPHLDKEIRELKLSSQERADLVAFMEALTGELPR